MNSSRFFCGIFGGATFTLLLLHFLATILPTPTLNQALWVGESLQIKKALARSRKTPQLLLLGGSNVHFGFSAQVIHDHYGIPATNVAVHAGLGRKYILDYARQIVKEGDLVVLIPEYELFGKAYYESALYHQLLVHDKPYYHSLPVHEKVRLLAQISLRDWRQYLRNRISPDERATNEYLAETLNAFGDETANHEDAVDTTKRKALSMQQPAKFGLDAAAMDDYRRYAEDLAGMGARLVLAYPSMLESALDLDSNAVFFEELARSTASAGLRLIGKPKDRVFTLEESYDTIYHPLREVQIRNTHKLMEQLKSAGVALPRPYLDAQ